MKHLPNTLTIVRILVTPVVLLLVFADTLSGRTWAFALFVFASISDYLDGKLARHWSVGSRLGQFLDPVADKVLVLGTFAGLAVLRPDVMPWWAFIVIAGRDVAVTLLRMWHLRKGRTLRTSGAAKTKTTFQLTFLISVLLLYAAVLLPGSVGHWAGWLLGSIIVQVMLWLTVAATVLTGVAYFRAPEYENGTG